MKISRRGLLSGLTVSLVCAPAIVRAGSLMPVKARKGCIGQDSFIEFPFSLKPGAVNLVDCDLSPLPNGGFVVWPRGWIEAMKDDFRSAKAPEVLPEGS